MKEKAGTIMRYLKSGRAIYVTITVIILMSTTWFLKRMESQTWGFKIRPVYTRGTDVIPMEILFAIIVYFMHLIPIVIWYQSIRLRVPDSKFKKYLLYSHNVMLIHIVWSMFIRTILDTDIPLLRFSGHVTGVLVFLYIFFDFIAAMYLQEEKRYFTCLKIGIYALEMIMIALIMTNDFHQLFAVALPGEYQPNLKANPGPLFVFALLLQLILTLARLAIILKRGYRLKNGILIKIIPLIQILLFIIILLPYFFNSFVLNDEPVEITMVYMAFNCFIWESCIYAGLVPANMNFKKMLYLCTADIMILGKKLDLKLKSSGATKLKPEQFTKLRKRGRLLVQESLEYQISEIEKGYLVWQKDISKLLELELRLRRTGNQLLEEYEILKQEYEVRKRRSRLENRKRIFDNIYRNMEKPIRRLKTGISHLREVDKDRSKSILNEMNLYAVLVKRYSNLYLLSQIYDRMHTDDIFLSFKEFKMHLEMMGISFQLIYSSASEVSTDFFVLCMKIWGLLFEYMVPKESEILCEIAGNADCVHFFVQIHSYSGQDGLPETLRQVDPFDYSYSFDMDAKNVRIKAAAQVLS